MPEVVGHMAMSAGLTLDAIACKEEEAVVVDYILKASNNNLDPQYPPDVKTGFDELCPVCGDKVSGYHYGLLTCESCKGFFKRTVQNKKVYSCVDNRQCPIDKSQRKRCPYCRFQKCLQVGMKLEAVRQDRMRGGRNKFGPMYKRDRALKQQQLRNQQRLMSECEMNLPGPGGAAPPASPPDIKPDPALLHFNLGLSGYGAASLAPHPADLSSMAAAMAAAVVGVSGAGGESREGASSGNAATTTSVASSGSGYINLSGGGQGMPGGSGGSPIPLEEGGALNLHTPQAHHHPSQHPPVSTTQHNGFHHPAHSNNNSSSSGGSTTNRSAPHLPPHHHNHSHHHPHPPMENSYLLHQAHQHFGGGGSGVHTYSADARTSPPTPIAATHTDKASSSPPTTAAAQGFGGPQHPPPPPLAMFRPSLPPLLCEIKANLLEEGEMKQKMLSFLADTLRQMDGVVSHAEQLLPVICRMVDQLLFLMVEWARNSPFFKEIRVEDQMKLLQNSWSQILILDFVYRQVQEYWGSELLLPNGSRLNFDTLEKLELRDVRVQLLELIKKAKDLKLDYNEYMCLKFLILLSTDISGLENRQFVEESQEKVNSALQTYCKDFYPTMHDKFSQILLRLPEVRVISMQMENFLYYKHLNHQVPDQTLLTEMLHSRRK